MQPLVTYFREGPHAMTVAMIRRAATPIAAALLGSAITALLLLGRPEAAMAQNPAVQAAAPVMLVSYALRQVDANSSSLVSRTDFQTLYKFERSPVFLVRNKTALTVAEVSQEGTLRKLGEIPLQPDFKEVMILGDDQSFIVRHDRYIRVFKVDRKVGNVTDVTYQPR